MIFSVTLFYGRMRRWFKATFVLRFGGDKTPHNIGIILNYFQCLQFSLQTLRLDHMKIQSRFIFNF